MFYKDSGVDIDKADDLVKFIKNINKLDPQNIGPFAALFDLHKILKEYKEPLLVASTDGIGTKIELAIKWNYLDFLGYDLVGMCVNDIATCGAKPLFFLDYFATSRLDLEIAKTVIKIVVKACEEIKCPLIGGETAELPGLLVNSRFDIAGFIVGVQEKLKIPRKEKVSPGDVVIGLPSNGIHSNGYSLVRAIIEKKKLEPETEFEGKSLKETLLAPTKLYSTLIHELFKQFDIHGAAHITGGGIPGNVERVINPKVDVLIEKKNWKIPVIFKKLQEWGEIPEEEMFRVFNMGIGFTLIVPEKDVEDIKEFLHSFNEEFYIIGRVTEGNGKVRII